MVISVPDLRSVLTEKAECKTLEKAGNDYVDAYKIYSVKDNYNSFAQDWLKKL